MNFKKFEIYGNPTLQQGGWTRTGEGDAYVKYITIGETNYYYRICTLDYVPNHHPTQITITGIASKELEVCAITIRNDNYIIASLGWQENGYTFDLGSTYDKLGIMFRFKNGDAITPNHVSFDIVGDWTDTPHYIRNTSTDTITTLPAVLYPNDTTATVGLKGNTLQSSIPSPTSPVMPQGTGERTGNLFDEVYSDISGTIRYRPIFVGDGTFTLSTTTPYDNGVANVFLLSGNVSSGASTLGNGAWKNHNVTAQSVDGYVTIAYRCYSGTTSPVDCQTMLNTGSTPFPYEIFGYKIPISSANTTTPVYLGEVETTRKIKKLVLTGDENWGKDSSKDDIDDYFYTDIILDMSPSITPISSHFVSGKRDVVDSVWATGTTANPRVVLEISKSYTGITSADGRNARLAKFKAYLAAQYAAGTPVTVWYVLATETTGTVNEPLRKIGDYADEVSGITIPTIAGANTISVGTTLQPSEVTVNYKGWHPVSAVHERENGAWT